MKVSYKWLETYFAEKIPSPDKLSDLFAMHCFEIEGIETASNEDTVLDIKILPDRAHYDLSHKGIADEIYFITGVEPRNRYAPEISSTIDTKTSVRIENQNFCRRYIARSIKVAPSLSKSKVQPLIASLEAIGQRSIGPIVDAANYVMYDIGQPLHAFDADKIKGSIVIRAAKEGEKITLLDGREVSLTSSDNVIADDEGPLVIAGAKGGKRAEVSETTTNIIVEAANFEPTSVRRTSTKYDIRSDASKRFENEISPELAMYGINNFCAIIKELYPQAQFGPIVDSYPVKPAQRTIKLDPKYVESRLGISVPEKEMKIILKRMGIMINDENAVWQLGIPFSRLDLTIPEDIVEEVGRVYGYDKISGTLPDSSSAKEQIIPIFYISQRIRSILANKGFSEVSLYSLVEKGDIETLKPLAKDKAFIRNNLSEGMLAAVQRNSLNADLIGLDAIKIFEIGHVFTKDGEMTHLSIGAAQIKKVKGRKGSDIINEAVSEIESEFGSLKEYTVEVGSLKNALKQNAASAPALIEINIQKISEKIKPEHISYDKIEGRPISTNRFKKYSNYPFILRDIAVFVPEEIEAGAVWDAVSKSLESSNAKELLVRNALFDTFKKDGRVSYAFRLVFQSMDRTLTDSETNQIMQAVSDALKNNGWEVR